jgi:hypothetical protein
MNVAFLVILLFVFFAFIFWIAAIVDVVRRQFTEPTMKIVWVLIILFGHFLGALLYFVIGRSQGSLPGSRA